MIYDQTTSEMLKMTFLTRIIKTKFSTEILTGPKIWPQRSTFQCNKLNQSKSNDFRKYQVEFFSLTENEMSVSVESRELFRVRNQKSAFEILSDRRAL